MYGSSRARNFALRLSRMFSMACSALMPPFLIRFLMALMYSGSSIMVRWDSKISALVAWLSASSILMLSSSSPLASLRASLNLAISFLGTILREPWSGDIRLLYIVILPMAIPSDTHFPNITLLYIIVIHGGNIASNRVLLSHE